MLAFRTLVGFGIPGAVVAFNLLLELTPTKMRGMFAVGIEGFWTVGTIIQAGFAYGLLNQYGWRWLVAASTVPCGASVLRGQCRQLLLTLSEVWGTGYGSILAWQQTPSVDMLCPDTCM